MTHPHSVSLLIPGSEWTLPPARTREARMVRLAEEMMFLTDELRGTWELEPKAGSMRCPLHRRRPLLGSPFEIEEAAICPVCVTSHRLRSLERQRLRLVAV